MITTADIIVFLSFARANLYLLYLNHHLQEDQVHTFHRKFGRTAFFFKKMNPKRYRPFLGTMLSSKKIVSTSNSSFLFFSSSIFRFGAVVENLSTFTMWCRGGSTSKLIREGSTKINLSKFLQLYSSRITITNLNDMIITAYSPTNLWISLNSRTTPQVGIAPWYPKNGKDFSALRAGSGNFAGWTSSPKLQDWLGALCNLKKICRFTQRIFNI